MNKVYKKINSNKKVQHNYVDLVDMSRSRTYHMIKSVNMDFFHPNKTQVDEIYIKKKKDLYIYV